MTYLSTKTPKLRGLASQLVGHMHHKDVWFSKGTLTDDTKWFNHKTKKRYLSETVGRALRYLEEMSVLAVKDDGISVQYRWIPFELRSRYIPFSMRPDLNKAKLFMDKEHEA